MGREEEIRNSIDGMSEAVVKDALAMLLVGKAAERPRAASAGSGIDDNKFSNFAQAVNYLKKHYKFKELEKFRTEADLVYVDTGERKVLLTEAQAAQPATERKPSGDEFPRDYGAEDGAEEPAAFEPVTRGGRFGNLEL